MDYIKQINGLWARQLAAPVSPQAICLYFALLHIANKAFWRVPLIVPMRRLEILTNASASTIKRTRQELINAGLIRLLPRGGRAAPIYDIVDTQPRLLKLVDNDVDSL